jgi:hypothetical protein
MNSLDMIGYCKRLEAVGVPRHQAEVHAQVLAEVMAQVATKDDLAVLKDDLDAREARLKEWVMLYVKEQIQSLKVDMLKWYITLSIAQTSLIIAALRYLPH